MDVVHEFYGHKSRNIDGPQLIFAFSCCFPLPLFCKKNLLAFVGVLETIPFAVSSLSYVINALASWLPMRRMSCVCVLLVWQALCEDREKCMEFLWLLPEVRLLLYLSSRSGMKENSSSKRMEMVLSRFFLLLLCVIGGRTVAIFHWIEKQRESNLTMLWNNSID